MSAVPLLKSFIRTSLFSDSGEQTAKLQLFQAVFYDRTQQALEIIKTDPEQINEQEPFAGLAALHLAIFRQNIEVTKEICTHPVTKINLEDRFGRKAIDMCVYTDNEEIFRNVSNATFKASSSSLSGFEFRTVRS